MHPETAGNINKKTRNLDTEEYVSMHN